LEEPAASIFRTEEYAEYGYKKKEDRAKTLSEHGVTSYETVIFIVTSVRITKHRCVTCERMLGFQRQ
jgi:hypothetical protein